MLSQCGQAQRACISLGNLARSMHQLKRLSEMLPIPGGMYLMIPVMIQIMVLLKTKRKQGLWLVRKASAKEAHMLQREAKRTSIANNFSVKWCLGCWLLGQPWMGQHTSLLHVFCLWVGFSDCSSAKYQAMHAVKALHGLRLLHGDIRESNILCISEAEQVARLYSLI